MGIDPDGEFVVTAMVIGAVLNTVIQGATGNIDNLGDFGLAMGVGALSGAAGGAAGGFVGGFGNTAIGGGSFNESYKAGILGAGIGGLSGGILGGISAGISSNQAGYGFWDGEMDLSKYFMACDGCPYYGMPDFTVLGKYNPVIAGMHQAGQSFWGHPVTQATVFVATSVIGGGIASSILGASSKGLQASHIASRMTGQAVQNAAKASTQLAKSGIYEFTAASGKTYVGQSKNIALRLQQHIKSGKLLQGTPVKTTEVLGGKTAREIAEQLRINSLGGIRNLENLRNPIGSARQYLLLK